MKSIFALLACLFVAATACARDLNVATAKKTEVRHGQVGPRDTIIFYEFTDQAAVLQLNVKHEAGKFTIMGRMQLFAEGTSAEAIGMWINNQHSCGLFPEVPNPIVSVDLAADGISVVESKRKEGEPQEGPMGDKFEDYAVTFEIAELKSQKGFTLKGFSADTSLFVKIGPSA
jgi:hypothetical protein